MVPNEPNSRLSKNGANVSDLSELHVRSCGVKVSNFFPWQVRGCDAIVVHWYWLPWFCNKNQSFLSYIKKKFSL